MFIFCSSGKSVESCDSAEGTEREQGSRDPAALQLLDSPPKSSALQLGIILPVGTEPLGLEKDDKDQVQAVPLVFGGL